MKLEDNKEAIDKYFDNVDPAKLVTDLEAMGCIFIDPKFDYIFQQVKNFIDHKVNQVINVIIDTITPNTLSELQEIVFKYIFARNIECRIIFADIEIKEMEIATSVPEVQNLMQQSFGGTELMPGIEFFTQKYNDVPLLILTDGYTDTLILNEYNHDILILASNICPINRVNNKTTTTILITNE